MKLTPMVFVLVAALAGGCATRKTAISEPMPSIALNTSQAVRASGAGPGLNLTLPAGEYRPAFRDPDGIYYRPVAETIIFGQPRSDAYLLVPDEKSKPIKLWLQGGAKTFELTPQPIISSLK